VYEIACALYRNLERAILEHYNCLQRDNDGEVVFYDQEERKLRLMKFFYSITGYINLYESHIAGYQSMFEKKRLERAKK